MPMRDGLSSLSGFNEEMQLDRNLLRDRAADVLRDLVVKGQLPEGTRLTERAVSQFLGISRMPAHEALMALEAQGLLERRSDGRYVVELDENDVRDLCTVRWALERLAVEQAAAKMNDSGRALLMTKLRELEEAVATGDPDLCTRCDLAIHQAIWGLADNAFVPRLLESLLGVIYVLAARVKLSGSDRQRLLSNHRELVALVAQGDGHRAAQAIDRHLEDTIERSLRTFRTYQLNGQHSAEGHPGPDTRGQYPRLHVPGSEDLQSE